MNMFYVSVLLSGRLGTSPVNFLRLTIVLLNKLNDYLLFIIIIIIDENRIIFI